MGADDEAWVQAVCEASLGSTCAKNERKVESKQGILRVKGYCQV